MERPKHTTAIIILSIVYLVGIIGYATPQLQPLFMKLAPANLIFTLIMLFWFDKKFNMNTLIALLIIGALGYLVEVLGVKTGLIFGQYQYGDALGYKVAGVPLIIGANWVLVVFSTLVVVKKYTRFDYSLFTALLAGLICTTLDFFIESQAPRFDYWYWQNGNAPFQNYLAWFVIASLFAWALERMLNREKIRNKLAFHVLFLQFAFFIVLKFIPVY